MNEIWIVSCLLEQQKGNNSDKKFIVTIIKENDNVNLTKISSNKTPIKYFENWL